MKKSFAFNSVDGDRKYNADNIADNTAIFYSNGIVTQGSSTELKVSAVSGMQVKVANGTGIIQGRTVVFYGEEDGTETVTLDTADATYDRIDRIVLELNLASNVRDIVLKAVKGTPVSSPVAPDLTRNDVVYQISLAQVRVVANTSTVGTITDERSNEVVCGYSKTSYMQTFDDENNLLKYDRDVTVADASNVPTEVRYKRHGDNTLFLKRVMSNPDANGFYRTITETFYIADGVTSYKTVIYSLTYFANGLVDTMTRVVN